jgi:hypothetical protein
MSEFVPSVAAVAGILLAFGFAGWLLAPAFLPRGAPFAAERLGWGFAAGLALVALSVPLGFLFRLRPGWPAHLLFAGLALAAGWLLRRRNPRAESRPEAIDRPAPIWLWGLPIAMGCALFGLRAMTEPMWSNDFLAIWGLKGKLIFALGEVPERLYRDPDLAFSHPEYPLGLPFLYAGIAFLLGRWDDHAMAILFPLIQAATLFVLAGWLRRRGAPRSLALGAAALLALDERLYSAFHTGLADIPLSLLLLLLATSFSDALDRTDAGAPVRVALASCLIAATKNEGLFFVAAALLLGFLLGRETRRRAQPALSVALLLPALAVVFAHRLWRGSVPLKDFDFRYLQPSLWGELGGRLRETFAVALHEVARPAWPLLAAITILFIVGRPTPSSDRLLALAAIAGAAYLILPAFGIFPASPEFGPIFLVRTALGRTFSALSPLVAAGITGRLTPIFDRRARAEDTN